MYKIDKKSKDTFKTALAMLMEEEGKNLTDSELIDSEYYEEAAVSRSYTLSDDIKGRLRQSRYIAVAGMLIALIGCVIAIVMVMFGNSNIGNISDNEIQEKISQGMVFQRVTYDGFIYKGTNRVVLTQKDNWEKIGKIKEFRDVKSDRADFLLDGVWYDGDLQTNDKDLIGKTIWKTANSPYEIYIWDKKQSKYSIFVRLDAACFWLRYNGRLYLELGQYKTFVAETVAEPDIDTESQLWREIGSVKYKNDPGIPEEDLTSNQGMYADKKVYNYEGDPDVLFVEYGSYEDSPRYSTFIRTDENDFAKY